MGAWSTSIFGNDTACDWSYGLEETVGLHHIEATIENFEAEATDYIDTDVGCECLAACEALSRLLGKGGKSDAYTATMDAWVGANPGTPSRELLDRAKAAALATLADNSELAELWAGDEEWIASVHDVVARLG